MRRSWLPVPLALFLCVCTATRARGGDLLAGVSGAKALERARELLDPARRLDDVVVKRMQQIGLEPKGADATFVSAYPAAGTVGPWGPSAAGRNVLGSIPGRDPDVRGDIVIVGASSSPSILGSTSSVQGVPSPLNGVDPSALAVLLHVAEVLRANGWQPRRTILFAGLGGPHGMDGLAALAAGLPHAAVVAALLVDGAAPANERGFVDAYLEGTALFPRLGEALLATLPEGEAQNPFPGLTGRSLANPLAARGIPTFELGERHSREWSRPMSLDEFLSGSGPGPLPDPPLEPPGATLERLARRLATMIVWLGDRPGSLRDPYAFEHMVLNEVSRAAWARQFAPGSRERHLGLSVALRDAVAGAPRAAALDLDGSLLGRIEGPVPTRRVRSNYWAWRWVEGARHLREGIPWFRLRWHDRVPSVAEVVTAAKEEFTWIAPFAAGRALTVAECEAIAKEVIAQKLLLDLTGLSSDQYATIASMLAGRPAALAIDAGAWMGPDGDARRKALGPSVRLLADGDPKLALRLALDDREGLAPAVVVSGDSDGLVAAMVVHQSLHAPTWFDARSGDRKALRDALGGRIVAWLRRLE